MTKLIIGSNSQKLGKYLSKSLELEQINAKIGSFEDGEFRIQLEGDLHKQKVLIVQSTSKPVNDSLVELLLLIDASKHGGANHVTVLMPYFGYSRQNQSLNNQPVSAQLMAKLLETAGANQIITMDLHAKASENFFKVPIHNVETTNLFAEALKDKSQVIIVSPDAGGAERAQKLAQVLNMPCVVLAKRRSTDGACTIDSNSAEVRGHVCVLVDDIIDTGNTLCQAAEFLMQKGATAVEAIVTHAVLSGQALKRIEESAIEHVIITETIEQKVMSSKIRILDIGVFIAEQIKLMSTW